MNIPFNLSLQASLITKDVTLSGAVKMLAVSRDILAISPIFDGGKSVLVYQDTAIPLRKSIPVPLPADTVEVCVKIVYSPDTELAELKLAVEKQSKLYLGKYLSFIFNLKNIFMRYFFFFSPFWFVIFWSNFFNFSKAPLLVK